MADYNDISESIQSLRTETAPDSVTPERVGNLLQAIVDLIKALSLVPDVELASIMQTIQNAQSTAAAAAADKLITQFKSTASNSGVTLTVKQSGHEAKTFSFPVANASRAGIVLPSLLQSISDAADAAANNRLGNISRTWSPESGLILTFKSVDNVTLYTLTLPWATALQGGLMGKDDKSKLDALPANGVVGLDDAGRVPAENAPQVMLRNVTGAAPDNLQIGDFYLEASDNHIWYNESAQSQIDMGVPSKNVVYCHTDTGKLYRWTGTQMVQVAVTVRDDFSGGTADALSAEKGKDLKALADLAEAKYRNLVAAINGTVDYSALKNALSSAAWDVFYPVTLQLNNCTLQEDVPAVMGTVDTFSIKVKAKNGYYLTTQSVTILDDGNNDITEDFHDASLITYNNGTGVLTVMLEDPGEYHITISATHN